MYLYIYVGIVCGMCIDMCIYIFFMYNFNEDVYFFFFWVIELFEKVEKKFLFFVMIFLVYLNGEFRRRVF